MRLVLLALAALVLAGCGDDELAGEEAMEALIAFAHEPSEETWSDVPLAPHVDLGRGKEVRARRSAEALRDPDAWTLSLEYLYRARAGTTSALELIAGWDGALRVGFGAHENCVSPPVPPPPQAAGLERVYVQPRAIESCLQWWTVDAFLDGDGRIRAVTLDLWEP